MNYLLDVEINGHILLTNMIDSDYIDNYDVIYCPESGSMCNTTRDCVFCPYRNNYLDIKSKYIPKDTRLIIV